MENLLQNIASGLWIVLGVYCFFGLRKWNKRFSELYNKLKEEIESWTVSIIFARSVRIQQVTVTVVSAWRVRTGAKGLLHILQAIIR